MQQHYSYYTIPFSQPFAKLFVKGVLERYGSDPLTLANISIFLPNKRSIQAIKDAFLQETEGTPLLLPKLMTLGDSEEYENILFWNNKEIAEAPVSPYEEQLILTKLIHHWRDDLTLPQSMLLAKELSSFLAEVSREKLSLENLFDIIPEELAEHWQITLDFLKIIMHQYPALLKEKQQLTYWDYHNHTIDSLVAEWKNNPPQHPVIVAGSTASTPATALLVETVAALPLGAVVFPGLETKISEQVWQSIGYTHPYYGLKKILDDLDIPLHSIHSWKENSATEADPVIPLLMDIMLPEQETRYWYELAPYPSSAVERISILEAEGYYQESYAIALMLREVLNTPERKAALVTHDQTLAKHVIALLKKWDINVDYSAGMPLTQLAEITFLQLIAEAVTSHIAPTALLELLKHPFCCVGESREQHLENTRHLEKSYLRGIRFSEGLEALVRATEASSSDLSLWLKELEQFLLPITQIVNSAYSDFSSLFEAHIAVGQALSPHKHLWQGEKGEQAYNAISEIRLSCHLIGKVNIAEYAALLMMMFQGKTYRPRYGGHPRLSVISPIEARLQQFDRVVLGGLNEGSWPPSLPQDPWMSKPMRERFGLPLAERKIGMAAHDFIQCFSAKEVFLTRAKKVDGVEAIPSRWIMRLKTVLTATGQFKPLQNKGIHYLKLVESLTKEAEYAPCLPPLPIPPLEARPVSLSVTAIEKLMRNPYYIYANKILRLKKLDPIDKPPGAAEFGTIIHEALELFALEAPYIAEDAYFSKLIESGQHAFKKFADKPSVYAFWWPRFKRIAIWFAEYEKERKKTIQAMAVETKGEYCFKTANGKFTLSAKADRIETHHDGIVSIIDYKTGTPPSAKDIKLGYACQLTLEAVILRNSGFAEVKEASEVATEYWKLSGTEKPGEIISSPKDIINYINEAESGVQALINYFLNEQTPYLADPNPRTVLAYNDYLHLSRKKEWENT